MPGDRPNVVWLLSEDNNPFLGAYGDPVARTPVLDGLAREGIVYEVAHCPSPVCAPSRFSYLTGLYAETAGPAHHMRARALLPPFVRGFPALLRDAGYYAVNNHKTDYNAEVDCGATWDASSGTASWRHRPAGSPFFAQFTNLTTHESCLFGDGEGPTRPEDVRVPASLPDTPTVRRDIARYHDRMTVMDAELGVLLAQLDEDGLADDTIVFYFGDNGGSLPFSKRFCTEAGLRIPLIVRVPPRWAHLAPGGPGSRVTDPVDGVDLAPTVLALAGIEVPAHVQGRPFLGPGAVPRRHVFGQRGRMDDRYDLQRSVRDERWLYVRNYAPHRPYGQHVAYMWQQRSYQEWERLHLDGALDEVRDRFWRDKPSEELYDVPADPDCVRNLVGDPAAGADEALERLRRALDEHLVETNDNGFLPEGHPLEGYEASRAPGAYPLADVLAVAGTAIERDPGNLERLVADLGHPHDVVRWWAAQGLLMLGPAAAPAVPALAATLDGDPSVHVRIPTAEALARLGHPDPAVATLAATLDDHPDASTRVQALDALTWVGADARAHRDVVARAAASTDDRIRYGARYLLLVLDGAYAPDAPIFDGVTSLPLSQLFLTC